MGCHRPDGIWCGEEIDAEYLAAVSVRVRASYGHGMIDQSRVWRLKFRVLLVLCFLDSGDVRAQLGWALGHGAGGCPGGAGRELANARRQTTLCRTNHFGTPWGLIPELHDFDDHTDVRGIDGFAKRQRPESARRPEGFYGGCRRGCSVIPRRRLPRMPEQRGFDHVVSLPLGWNNFIADLHRHRDPRDLASSLEFSLNSTPPAASFSDDRICSQEVGDEALSRLSDTFRRFCCRTASSQILAATVSPIAITSRTPLLASSAAPSACLSPGRYVSLRSK